jgi:biotin carboxyl carrier protein
MTRERLIERDGAPGARAPSRLSVAEVRALIALMSESDIEEITVEREAAGLRLTLRKPAPEVALRSASGAVETDELDALDEDLAALGAEGEVETGPHLVDVCAPLVGRFRAAMSRDGAPLVAMDAMVKPGQVVAAVEALNVLNEVEASVAGRVKAILVHDGDFVEYGKPLLRIELSVEPS